MTLTEFLLARIADDEAMAAPWGRWHAECEAKRRIIEKAEAWVAVALEDEDGEAAILAIGLQASYPFLALPYADHKDYRSDWKP